MKSLFLIVLQLLVSSFASSVTLMWDPNTEPDVVQYKVNRAINGGGYIATAVNAPTHQITYSDIAPGNSYSFYVTAVNSQFLESGPSALLAFTPAPLLPAINVTKVAPSGVAGTSWTGVQVFFNPIDMALFQVSNYTITATATGGGVSTITATNSPAVFPLLPIKAYTFSVTASNSSGTSPAGTTAALTGVSPAVVANVKVQVGP